MNQRVISFFLSSCVLLGTSQATIPTVLAVNTDTISDFAVSDTIPAAAFSLHASQLRMDIGEQQHLTAISQYNTDMTGIIWHSSDETICSVDSQGTITAVSNGCAEITAALDGFSAKLSIHVGLSKPDITSISLTNNGNVSLSWSSVSDSDGYRVYYRASDAQPWEACETLTTLQWTDEQKYTGGEYSVRAFKLRNSQTDDPLTLWSAYASPASTNIPTVLPPTEFSAASASSNEITLHWKGAAYADGYFIYRKTSAEDPWTLLTDITDSEQERYSDTTVTAGRTYYYTIRSYQLVNEEHILSTYDSNGISCNAQQPSPVKKAAETAQPQISSKSSKICAQYTATCSKNTFADVIIACKAIDGTVIEAGKSFSFDIASKPSAVQHSISGSIFEPAVVQSPLLSGGFCEVSDALYQLAKRAELTVSMSSGSTPKTKTAPFSIHLKNTTKHPLVLKAVFHSGILRVQLLNAS